MYRPIGGVKRVTVSNQTKNGLHPAEVIYRE